MAAIHELTSVTALPEFDLFSVPPTQTSIEKAICTEHRPISTLSAASDIEFVVPTGIDEYLRIGDTKLYVRARVILKKLDNTDVKAEDWAGVSLTNNFAGSLFQHVNISVLDKPLQLSLNTYPYRSYIETLIGYEENARKSHLSSSLWHEVEKKQDTDPEALDPVFQPLIKSVETDVKRLHLGQPFEILTKLNLDLTFQGRALLGGTTYTFKLTPHSPKFFLHTNDKYLTPTIELLDARLYVYKSKVNTQLVQAHEKALEIATAKYPITRCEVRSFTINQGVVHAIIDNAITGQLPRRVFLGFVSNEAFNGSYSKNPFNFKHYDINFLACYLDGEQIPSQAYTPDFANDKYLREYSGLFEAADQSCTCSKISLNRWDYKKGYTLFGFNFAPDLSNGCGSTGHVNLIRKGSLRVEVHFAKRLPETVNAVIYCEFDNLIEFTPERNPITNYN